MYSVWGTQKTITVYLWHIFIKFCKGCFFEIVFPMNNCSERAWTIYESASKHHLLNDYACEWKEFSHTVLWVFDLFVLAVSIEKACSETSNTSVYTHDFDSEGEFKKCWPSLQPLINLSVNEARFPL